jgi:hypothetical protein
MWAALVTPVWLGVFALSLGISSSSAVAQGFVTGNQLLESCTVQEGDATFYQEDMFCASYVAGVVDTFVAVQSSNKVPPFLCMPAIPLGQARDVVVSHLQTHPEHRHINAAVLTWAALRLAYPCP